MYKKFKNKPINIKPIFRNVVKRKLRKVRKINKVYFKNNDLKFLVKSSVNKNNIKSKLIVGRNNLFYKNVKPVFYNFKIIHYKYNIGSLNNKYKYINYENNIVYTNSYIKLLNFFIERKNLLINV
jgi:hypothetical protein